MHACPPCAVTSTTPGTKHLHEHLQANICFKFQVFINLREKTVRNMVCINPIPNTKSQHRPGFDLGLARLGIPWVPIQCKNGGLQPPFIRPLFIRALRLTAFKPTAILYIKLYDQQCIQSPYKSFMALHGSPLQPVCRVATGMLELEKWFNVFLHICCTFLPGISQQYHSV